MVNNTIQNQIIIKRSSVVVGGISFFLVLVVIIFGGLFLERYYPSLMHEALWQKSDVTIDFIKTSVFLMGVLLLPCILVGVAFSLFKKPYITLDASGVVYKGKRIPWSQVKSIDRYKIEIKSEDEERLKSSPMTMKTPSRVVGVIAGNAMVSYEMTLLRDESGNYIDNGKILLKTDQGDITIPLWLTTVDAIKFSKMCKEINPNARLGYV